MWMMGYNEPHHEDYINTTNPTRKLRPLVPRPPPPTCAASSYNHRFHHDNPLLNHHHHHHHLVAAAEQNKREFNPQQMVVVSSRWNPTPEQLQTLEELYRRGTRTPSAEEIQHITAQLRRYGKIEGKNVFYWFQNHKARERQKRRRQLDKQPPFLDINTSVVNLDQRRDSEVEGTRNWAMPTFSEEKKARERPRKADHEGWIPVEQQEKEEEEGNEQLLLLHRRRKSFPATWNHLTNGHITLINSTCTFAPKTSPSLVVSHHYNHDVESFETLELFPVNREQPEKCLSDVNLNPRQFIEFLPLKK